MSFFLPVSRDLFNVIHIATPFQPFDSRVFLDYICYTKYNVIDAFFFLRFFAITD